MELEVELLERDPETLDLGDELRLRGLQRLVLRDLDLLPWTVQYRLLRQLDGPAALRIQAPVYDARAIIAPLAACIEVIPLCDVRPTFP